MTKPTGQQQPQHPTTYTLPADLVANIYTVLSQVPSGNAARVYVRLEDEIGRQNTAWQAGLQQPNGHGDNDNPEEDDDNARPPES